MRNIKKVFMLSIGCVLIGSIVRAGCNFPSGTPGGLTGSGSVNIIGFRVIHWPTATKATYLAVARCQWVIKNNQTISKLYNFDANIDGNNYPLAGPAIQACEQRTGNSLFDGAPHTADSGATVTATATLSGIIVATDSHSATIPNNPNP